MHQTQTSEIEGPFEFWEPRKETDVKTRPRQTRTPEERRQYYTDNKEKINKRRRELEAEKRQGRIPTGD